MIFKCPKCSTEITVHEYPYGYWMLEGNQLIQVCRECKELGE